MTFHGYVYVAANEITVHTDGAALLEHLDAEGDA
jgi:hypothetical protein